MSYDTPPTYYFNGIDYNGHFYGNDATAGTGSGVSASYVNNNFLKSNGDLVTSNATNTIFNNALISTNFKSNILEYNYIYSKGGKQYPPKAYDTVSALTDTQLLGKICKNIVYVNVHDKHHLFT